MGAELSYLKCAEFIEYSDYSTNFDCNYHNESTLESKAVLYCASAGHKSVAHTR